VKFAIKVIWQDGTEEYLKQGHRVAKFLSRKRAQEQVDFMKMGADDEFQSINIVPFPQGAE
jgi:hypothetical protein